MAGLSLSLGGKSGGISLGDEHSAVKKRLLFLLLAVLWYSCSFLSSSTSKALLSGKKVKLASAAPSSDGTITKTTSHTSPLFPYPVSLTALQFLFVFAFSYLLSSPTVAANLHRALGRPAPRNAQSGLPSGLMSTLIMVDAAKLREMVGLSFFNVAGHAMTAAAIQMVPVSTVHTVKALSPLFTVLSYVVILKLSYPLRTYLSLAPLTIGVIFACSGLSSIEGPKAWLGILLSVGSTVVFVAQNLWSKRLLGHALHGGGGEGGATPSSGVKLDKLNILFWSSGVSVLLMIPMLLWSDLPRMYAAGRAVADHPGSPLGHAAAQQAGSAARAAALDIAAAARATGSSASSGHTAAITRLLLANGVVHFSQNLLAFSVLALTSPVTYSVASLCKRVFVICFAILWFGQRVTGTQWVGIGLTFVGLWLYNDAKQRPSAGDAGAKGAALKSGAFNGPASMAAKEEEAALDFGLDRGSRRRTGILPTSGGSGSSGPIWKGMSNSLYGSSSAGSAGAGPATNGIPMRGMPTQQQPQYNGLRSPPVANGHANGSAMPGGANGAGPPPVDKGGAKRD